MPKLTLPAFFLFIITTVQYYNIKYLLENASTHALSRYSYDYFRYRWQVLISRAKPQS